MAQSATKYIFVTGGVLSGLGKGITAASIGTILKARGLNVNIQKLDPYLNVDAGTLNPAEHGECFVTKDGAETDLDLGHYERFLDIELTQDSSLMSGRIIRKLIEDERRGEFLGKTVQIIPHVTGAIIDYVEQASSGFDVHIAEVGGTVGDYEGLSFIEALRELTLKVGRENCLFVHVVYLPYLGASKEFKSKPAQAAVRDLRALGINPDMLVVRSEDPAPETIIDKLELMTGLDSAGIVLLPNAETVYQVPLTLEENGIGNYVVNKLSLKTKKPNLMSWKNLVESATTDYECILKVGVVAKYMDNVDTYKSVFEALDAAGWSNEAKVEIHWVESEELTQKNVGSKLRSFDGIVVPGGFGARGIEGKVLAADYALRKNVPYLGLCLGMQVGVIAFARQHLKGSANSTEFDESAEHPVIHIMEHQRNIRNKGGTMRLGDYECVLLNGSRSRVLYDQKTIVERHRHRYEFNNEYREQLEAVGLTIAGQSPDGKLVELIEVEDHPFFIASQFHPEFRSRPNRPHPLFDGFIAELKRKR